jgi:hypothetical protein
VVVKVEEEDLATQDLAIWDLADKAAGAALEVMVAVVLGVMVADVDPVAMVAAVVVMAGRAAAEGAMAAGGTAEAVVTEAVDLEWEVAVCLELVKVVLHKQKRKSGMQACLIL